MPTLLRSEGLRVLIYPNDLRPVHLIGKSCEVVFNLNCQTGPVEVRENYRFSRREIRRIAVVLTERLVELCAAWETIHGNA